MTATLTKHKNGQRKNAGRPPLRAKVKRPQGQMIARRLLVRAFCFLLVIMPAASTLNDSTQAFVVRSFAASGEALTPEAQTRASLLRRVAGNTDALNGLTGDAIRQLFGEPDLIRREGGARSVHYTSAECALDVYYSREGGRPDYVEYRLRGDGRGVEAYRSCLRSLVAGARFGAPKPAAPTVTATMPDGRV